MKYSDIKLLKRFCDNLDSDYRELLELAGSDDIVLSSDIRFLHEDVVDYVLADEERSISECMGSIDIDGEIYHAFKE